LAVPAVRPGDAAETLAIPDSHPAAVRGCLAAVQPHDRTRDDRESSAQLLLRLLGRLAHRSPEGVEEPVLKSWFICELAQERELAGLPRLSPERNGGEFARALRVLAFGSPRLAKKKGDLWLAPSAPKAKASAPLTSAAAPAIEPARKPEAPDPGGFCRRCGKVMDWPGPAGVVHANGTAEHHACRLWAAAERAVLSPDALADEAELTVRGEPLP
jgi:hypothetical protein